MINFVLCDDKKEFLKSIDALIDKVMMNKNVEYNKLVFHSYNDDFLNVVNNKSTKIYILDIEVGDKSGIEMAKIIRNKDMNSVLIFLTSHTEEGYTVLKDDFMCLSFISKLDNYKDHLERTLKKAVNIVNEKKSVKIFEKGVLYSIPLNDILYIYKDTTERKSIIVTDYNKVSTSKTIAELEKLCEGCFQKSHRSCIINKNRVKSMKFSSKIIVFDNGLELDYLSDTYGKVRLWSK